MIKKVLPPLLIAIVIALSSYHQISPPVVLEDVPKLDLDCGFTGHFQQFLNSSTKCFMKNMQARASIGQIWSVLPTEARKMQQIRSPKFPLSLSMATVMLLSEGAQKMDMFHGRLASES
jgi:hypothetical protein